VGDGCCWEVEAFLPAGADGAAPPGVAAGPGRVPA
jgi:hypothetical protein